MTSAWKKSDSVRLAIVVFVLAVVIGGRFGYADVVAVRTVLFFASLVLFWLARWCFVNWVKGEPDNWYFWEGFAISTLQFIIAIVLGIAAVYP